MEDEIQEEGLTKPAIELGNIESQAGWGEGEEAVASLRNTSVDGDGGPGSVGLIADLQAPREPKKPRLVNVSCGDGVSHQKALDLNKPKWKR